MSVRYVTYVRVSTQMQGRSGLGLDAQRAAIQAFLKPDDSVIGTFTEVESGRRCDRPQLLLAVAMCRARRATLLIAKLDRLARNVKFVATLMESDTKFVAIDVPDANPLMLHMVAAFAEHEGKLISERIKAALGQAKLRGVKLGGYRGTPPTDDARRASADALRRKTQQYHVGMEGVIKEALTAECNSYGAAARYLNLRECLTINGRKWSRTSLRRYVKSQMPAQCLFQT